MVDHDTTGSGQGARLVPPDRNSHCVMNVWEGNFRADCKKLMIFARMDNIFS
jgi:hypothetical protein